MDTVSSVHSSCTVTKPEKSDSVCNVFLTAHYKINWGQYSGVLSVAESNTSPTLMCLKFKYTGQAEGWDIIYT